MKPKKKPKKKQRTKMDDRENYFDFVTGVLGIKSMLLDQEAAGGTTKIPLLLAVEGLSGYSKEENELLAKMIAALKMDAKTYLLTDLQKAGDVQRDFTVEFRDQKKETSVPDTQQVFSPRTLLKEPALKKQAWEDLQKVIRHFSA
jgi:hypothetical protein